MKILNSGGKKKKTGGSLRNFDLTVEEIKLANSIKNLTATAENIERLEPTSQRAKIIRMEIARQQERLDEIRENTLIQT